MQTPSDLEKRRSYITKPSAKFLLIDFFVFVIIIILYNEHAIGGLYVWVFLICFVIPSFFIPKIRYGNSSKGIQKNDQTQVFYCTNCGSPLGYGQEYCLNCGSKQ